MYAKSLARQQKIHTFFSPKAMARHLTNDSDNDVDEINCAKRFKAADTELPQLEEILGDQVSQIVKHPSSLPNLSANIGPSWLSALQPELSKPYFLELSRFLEQERMRYEVYPPENQVFSWTQLCSTKDIKVVILGQDPYHGPGQAHGLAFSVLRGVPKPPSLRNIFQELNSTVPGFQIPSHGNLTGWATQGVLLLNACLTVRAGHPNSHKDRGWEKLTDSAIAWVNSNLKGVVFLLWGAYAQRKADMISKDVHHVLSCAHPSPMSARLGFLGCKHFVKANDLLRAAGKDPINWSSLPIGS